MNKINRLYLGVFGGLLGICASGLLLRLITPITQSYISIAPLLCGALGGLGFGALTSSNNKMRGLIGCLFGFMAIIFGLIMTYLTPIVDYYVMYYSTGKLVPVYMWQNISFVEFVGANLLNLHGMIVFIEGLVAAYFLASHLPLKKKIIDLHNYSQLDNQSIG